jgi:pimeloyl-CoA synthetase
MGKVVRKDGQEMCDSIDIDLIEANVTKLSGKYWYNLELNEILPVVAKVDKYSNILREFCLGGEFTYVCGEYLVTSNWDMDFPVLYEQSWEMLTFIETIFKQYHENN